MKSGYRIAICLLASSSAFAGTMGKVPTYTPGWSVVGTLSGGPAWSDAGKNQTLFLQPHVVKTFTSKNHRDTIGNGEVFLGLQAPISEMLTGQLGLAYAATSHVNVHGDIWEDANPNFNDFYYNYNVKHMRLAIKGKVAADCGYFVDPYVSGSIGAGFNKSYDYSMSPKIAEQLAYPGFASHRNTSLSYTLGAGIQKTFNTNWQAGVGYEFADWGKANLARASGQTVGDGLKLKNVYTHGLQFSVSYLF